MPSIVSEWLNLLLRWIHVVAAILWIGQTFLFVLFDRLVAAGGRASLVHSGGFYLVERRTLEQGVPPDLKWFKWEAAITWISGFLLLTLVYHAGGLMIDASSGQSAGLAAGLGTALLVVGWVVYDGVWQSPLGRSERTATVVLLGLLAATTYGLCQIMSGRAAYIHIGALFGTIMTANVWMRILPAQRRMVGAAAEGRPVDYALGERGAQRTRHNNYLAIPTVAIMLSNHFPVATYGHRYNWVILLGVVLAGWLAAWSLRRR